MVGGVETRPAAYHQGTIQGCTNYLAPEIGHIFKQVRTRSSSSAVKGLPAGSSSFNHDGKSAKFPTYLLETLNRLLTDGLLTSDNSRGFAPTERIFGFRADVLLADRVGKPNNEM